MSKIIIERPYERVNKRKNINVYIDNEKVGTVACDETVHFDVSPGKHKVVLRNNWTSGSKSLEVDVSMNEDKTIRMSSFKYGWLFAFVVAFCIHFIYLLLNKQFNLESMISVDVYMLLFISLVLVIILLFFRKHDLKLKEVDGSREAAQPV